MGFERVTSIIQGTKNFTDFANAKISNYETDIFRPIFDEIEKLSGKKYGSTLPDPSATLISEPSTSHRRRLSRYCRSHPHSKLCHRRRHRARQHRPQLRSPPHPAPRCSLWPHPRVSGAVLLQACRLCSPGRWAMFFPRSGRNRSTSRTCSGGRRRRLTGRWIEELKSLIMQLEALLPQEGSPRDCKISRTVSRARRFPAL